MAVTPSPTNQAFLREVDEEVRRERMIDAGKRYGGLAAIAILVALLLMGGWMLWRHHRDTVRGETGEQLHAALEGMTGLAPAAAAASFAPIVQSDSPGYRSVARLAQADAKLRQKDLKGAAALFAQIASDERAAPSFRNLALVRQTAAEFDTLPPAQVVSRLRTLAVPGNPYLGSAGEMVGIAYIRMNRPDVANALFGQIAADETVPDTIRQRAVQMAGVLAATTAAQHQGKSTK